MSSSNRRGASRVPFSPRQLVGAAVLVIAIVFILENRVTTTIRLLLPEVSLPLWVALTVSVLLGIVAGGLLASKSR